MAVLVLVVNLPSDSIQTLNDNTQLPTKIDESINGCINILTAIEGGLKAGSVQVTTRDVAPVVSTSGVGSQQNTYNHL